MVDKYPKSTVSRQLSIISDPTTVAPGAKPSVLTELCDHCIWLHMSTSGQTFSVEKISKNKPPTCTCSTSMLSLGKNKNIIEYEKNNSFCKAEREEGIFQCVSLFGSLVCNCVAPFQHCWEAWFSMSKALIWIFLASPVMGEMGGGADGWSYRKWNLWWFIFIVSSHLYDWITGTGTQCIWPWTVQGMKLPKLNDRG